MIRISAAHRDALYEQIRYHLSGIGDVWIAVLAEEFERADRLARDYSDDLRLVLDDLGWGAGPGRSIELTTPPDVLLRVVGRLRERVAAQRETEEIDRARTRATDEHHQLVEEACAIVFDGLGAEAVEEARLRPPAGSPPSSRPRES